MANGLLQTAGNVRDNVVLFNFTPLRDFIDDGSTQAVESRRQREAGEPTPSSSGPGCAGDPAGPWVIVTHRILRGSETANFLDSMVGQGDFPYSYTQRGLPPGIAQSRWFTNCAYVTGGSSGPNSGGDKFEEFEIWVYSPIKRDLNILAATTP